MTKWRLVPEEPTEENKTFWSNVKKGRHNECWPWTGFISAKGYGQFSVNGQAHRAHRFSYELVNGPVPKGKQIDHLCRVRHCVNPNHLEAVTQKENILRGISFSAINHNKTHCPSGHEYTPDNTIIRKRGWRICLICHKKSQRKYYLKTRDAAYEPGGKGKGK